MTDADRDTLETAMLLQAMQTFALQALLRELAPTAAERVERQLLQQMGELVAEADLSPEADERMAELAAGLLRALGRT